MHHLFAIGDDKIEASLVRRGRGYALLHGGCEYPVALRALEDGEVEIEVASPDGVEKLKARARLVDRRDERDRRFKEMAKIWPSYLDYQKRTERIIPVVVLQPVRTKD